MGVEMVKEELERIFVTAVHEVFEKMYFAFLERREMVDKTRRDYGASISFSGPLSGEVAALFSRDLIDLMIDNSLGLDPTATAEQVREDCLKECLNILGGAFLQHLDPERYYRLSLPARRAPEEIEGQTAADETAITLAYDVEGRAYLEAIVRIKSG